MVSPLPPTEPRAMRPVASPDTPTEPRAMRPQARHTPVRARNTPKSIKQQHSQESSSKSLTSHAHTSQDPSDPAEATQPTSRHWCFEGPANDDWVQKQLAGMTRHNAIQPESERKRTVLGWGDVEMIAASWRVEKWWNKPGGGEQGQDW